MSFTYILPHNNPNVPNTVDITSLFTIPIETDKLLTDIKAAEEDHPYTRKTPGWHSIPLRSANGEIGEAASRSTGIYNSSDDSIYQDTEVMNHTPYIKHLLDNLNCTYLKIRIMRIIPGQAIGEHIDSFQSNDIIRIHIPVVTHPLVEFWIEKTLYKIPTEKLTYINVRRRHKVINKSNITRIHIVIDVKWDDKFGKRFYEAITYNNVCK